MRGALRLSVGFEHGQRIIPADAGSTRFVLDGAGFQEDHPRGCGEHEFLYEWDESIQGSSPRMRGAPKITIIDPKKVGIIPADAGSTRGRSCRAAECRDHPRGCGEHSTSAAVIRS